MAVYDYDLRLYLRFQIYYSISMIYYIIKNIYNVGYKKSNISIRKEKNMASDEM